MTDCPVPSIGQDHPAWQGYAKMSEAELKTLLGLIVDNPHVRQILEVGALNGFSTVNMALALEQRGTNGRITTIDIFQKDAERDDEAVFDRNCEAFGARGRIEKIKGYSADRHVLAAVRGRRFDLIFHDAEHRYWPVMRDILNYEELLAPSGYFVFHDYGDTWSLKRAVDEFFRRNPAYRLVFRVDSLIAFQKLRATSVAGRLHHRLSVRYAVRGLAFRYGAVRAVLGLWGGRERWL